MKSTLIRITLPVAISLALLIALPNASAAPAAPRHIEGELLVKFRGGPRSAAAEHARGLMKHEVKRNFKRIGWQHIRLPAGMSVEEAMTRYGRLPNVLAVEPNVLMEMDDSPTVSVPNLMGTSSIPNDPRFGQQWNLRLLEMTNAWAITPGSTNVVVAVLDTGIDYLHEDLRDSMWRNPGETGTDNQGRDRSTNGVDDDENGYIDDLFGIDTIDQDGDPMDLGGGQPRATGQFHGTACAGIIGATGNNALGMAGVNLTVRLMAVRVANTNNSIPYAASLEGVEYLIEMKERGVDIRVSNHSYGGGGIGFSQGGFDAAMAHQAAGIVWVNAAGNNALDNDRRSRSPMTFGAPHLISVAATESLDNMANYSNFGRSSVDLAAPGSNPLTTQPNNRYFTDYSGTSFAAPHVAGAVGLLAAAKPDATIVELRAALMHSVDQKPSLTNRITTHGRLNVGRALQMLTNDNLPPIVVTAHPRMSLTRADQQIQVWFSRPMDTATVEAAFEISPPVPGTFVWSSNNTHLTFVRSNAFEWTNHTVRIAASAASAGGLTLDGNFNRVPEATGADDYLWTFTFPPRNDDFENAELIAGQTGSVSNTTYNASWQFEPFSSAFTKANSAIPGSVWYRWTPAQSGWITFETAGSFDTLLSAYLGDELTALTELASNDDDRQRLLSRISFDATTDTNYALVVRTQHPSDQFQGMGPFGLRWYPTPPPTFTGAGFSTASGYPDQQVTLTGYNFTGATRVLFNGVSASFTHVATNADFQIIATIPHGATSGPITVETPHGNVTTAGTFTILFIPAITVRPVPGTNHFELSWLSVSGFTLQQNNSLATTSVWANAPYISTRLNSGIRYVVVTNAVPTRFFRLQKP